MKAEELIDILKKLDLLERSKFQILASKIFKEDLETQQKQLEDYKFDLISRTLDSGISDEWIMKNILKDY
jgi:hypothetical protein